MIAEHVITPRESPDLDGLACAAAYAELCNARSIPARAWIAGTPDPEGLYVFERLQLAFTQSPPRPESPIVLVDASDIRGLSEFVNSDMVIEVIDHRLHHRAGQLFPHATIQIEPVGAAATLIAERFVATSISPSPACARALQAAIISNTQGLKSSVTTDRDRQAIAWLKQFAPLPNGFVTQQFEARRLAYIADLGGAIRREQKYFDHPDGAYSLSQLELPGALGLIEACLPIVEALGPRAMLNLVDVDLTHSWLLVPVAECRAWVQKKTALTFNGSAAECPGILLRKQIVARLEGLT